MSPRLAIVVSHPTQYYSPWFAYLANCLEHTIKVFYLWDFGIVERQDPRFGQSFAWDIDLLSGYENEFVPNESKDPGTHHYSGLDNPRLIERLRDFRPTDVLLFGYRYKSHQTLIRKSRSENWSLLFRGDSHLLGHPEPSWIKRLMLSWIYRRFDAILFVGRANQRYFEKFGVSSQNLFFAPHSVNGARFPLPSRSESIAARRDILSADPDTIVILYSGKFHPEKAPLDLLHAMTPPPDSNCLLVFAGAGEQEPLLRETVESLGLTNVRFLPFANQSEMPQRYALADLFVLPSVGLYETWGLAVNEAMHCGVPCIVSDRVGCADDLISPDETGWTFPAGDQDALRKCLIKATAEIRNPERRARLKSAVSERINQYTYKQTTEGLISALRSIHHAKT